MPTKRTGNPRGRPPGAKNKPKTIEQFILAHTVSRPTIPEPKKKAKPRGWQAIGTPEERTAKAKMYAARRAEKLPIHNTVPRPEYRGRPIGMTGEQFGKLKKQVAPDVKRILKKMATTGELPEDEASRLVLDKALKTFMDVTSPKDIVSLGRLVLDFSKAKPAQKIDVTTRTHEDFLDELAEEESPPKE